MFPLQVISFLHDFVTSQKLGEMSEQHYNASQDCKCSLLTVI